MHPKCVARARRLQPASGRMNKTEAVYASHLALWKAAGHVLFYEFEPIKLRLADKTFYTPDFLVVTSDRMIELHEVKGFWRDDARVKIKVAAERFPMFQFVAVQRSGRNGWKAEEF